MRKSRFSPPSPTAGTDRSRPPISTWTPGTRPALSSAGNRKTSPAGSAAGSGSAAGRPCGDRDLRLSTASNRGPCSGVEHPCNAKEGPTHGSADKLTGKHWRAFPKRVAAPRRAAAAGGPGRPTGVRGAVAGAVHPRQPGGRQHYRRRGNTTGHSFATGNRGTLFPASCGLGIGHPALPPGPDA